MKIGNNVNVATEVLFMEHDIIHRMLNKKFHTTKFKEKLGTIEIGNDVFIGARSIILYNTKIGNNVIIGAGSIVTKNIPDNSVAVGVPAKVIGKFDDVVKKYEAYATAVGNSDLYDDRTQNRFFWR